jgi:hypothetical protein
MSGKSKMRWGPIIDSAAEIVRGYDTRVTLRQLFYRLVAAQVLPNTEYHYKHLSELTAEARRTNGFPALLDSTRGISRATCFDGPEEARAWLARFYRRDRTEGQSKAIYLGVEKAGLVALLESWYWDLGIPIAALKGYGSQTYMDEIAEAIAEQERPALMFYAGDYDSSGEDIQRDLEKRCPTLTVQRVALSGEQVKEYDLPENPGKTNDPRSAGFKERHGKLVQVEVDALPPETLKALFDAALDAEWDTSYWERSVRREKRDRKMLEGVKA